MRTSLFMALVVVATIATACKQSPEEISSGAGATVTDATTTMDGSVEVHTDTTSVAAAEPATESSHFTAAPPPGTSTDTRAATGSRIRIPREQTAGATTLYLINVKLQFDRVTCDLLRSAAKPGEPRSVRVHATLADEKGVEVTAPITIHRTDYASTRGSRLTVLWPHRTKPVVWKRIWLAPSDACTGSCDDTRCDRQIEELGPISVDEARVRSEATPPRPFPLDIRCCSKTE